MKPKHKSRPKKVGKTVLKEIDDKLQEFLLDIERDTNNTDIIGGLVPQEISTSIHVDMLNHRTCHSSKLKVNSRGGEEGENGVGSSSDCYATGFRFPETDIIDLMSPSPSVRARGVSECQDVKCIEVELSESDNDVSSEHARKARELRLFIARIGDRFLD